MELSRRVDYEHGILLESQLDPDPIVQLKLWLEEAEDAGVTEPNAMVLATVDATGRPSARNVLLRALDDKGVFSFFTNRESHKGVEIAANPNVCLLFSWLPVSRQVRVSGFASLMADVRSDRYFASRPREAQIGAWASPQSAVIDGREELDRRVAEVAERFSDGPVPRPPNWGGYDVRCTSLEFWQGRSGRLHDRIRYWRHGDNWRMERLAP